MKKKNAVAATSFGHIAARHFSRKPLWVSLVALGFCNAAFADEVSDLKELVKQLQQRIERLEAKSAPTAVAPAQVASPAPPAAASPANSVAATPGLQVRMYGRADIGYVSSEGSDTAGKTVTTSRFNQGQMASRLGLTGSWAYDADLKAIFGVETGLNLFNGNAGGGTQNSTATVLFNRGATAGLASNSYGSIEAGTMYMAPFWVMLGADNASANNYGLSDFSALFSVSRPEALGRYLKDPVGATANLSKTATGAGNNSGTALFYSNSVRYRTPTVEGFKGEFSYSMGQQAFGNTPLKDDGTTWGINAIYQAGPLFVGYGHMNYQQVNDIATTGTASNWVTREQETDILGARYTFADFTLGASYTSYRVSNAGGYGAKAYGLSGAYNLGKHRVEASVGRLDYDGANGVGAFGTNSGNGKGDPSTMSLGVGYLYNLTKNMSVYGYYNKMDNNSNANLGVNQFRADTKSFGFSPSEWTVGTFLTF